MKIISWNIRGLNNPHKHDIIRNMIRDSNPDIFLIQETKMSREKVESLKFLKNGNISRGSFEGASRGIATIWNLNTVKGQVIIQESNFSCIKFKHLKDGFSWVLTNIYAPNTLKARNSFWKRIRQARESFKNLSWMVMGDFNMPLKEEEKFGGSPPQLESRMALMDFIYSQALNDSEI